MCVRLDVPGLLPEQQQLPGRDVGGAGVHPGLGVSAAADRSPLHEGSQVHQLVTGMFVCTKILYYLIDYCGCR